jgi:holo-[acyl-carrier protein] synthase
MIIGIGVDIVDIDRIEKSLLEFGERFRHRIFTPGEIAYCEAHLRAGERYAARFAAKEAARKAFGAVTSIRRLSWQDVEIISSKEGAPHLRFNGAAAELADELGVTSSHVSLSHAINQAVAFVVLENGATIGPRTSRTGEE